MEASFSNLSSHRMADSLNRLTFLQCIANPEKNPHDGPSACVATGHWLWRTLWGKMVADLTMYIFTQKNAIDLPNATLDRSV